MNRNKNLPIFGVGPIYGIVIIALTVAGIILSSLNLLDSGKVTILWIKILFIIFGSLICLWGFIVWQFCALGKNCIDKYIKKGELYTGGIYSIVRNPAYSGIALMCTGALMIAHNLWLLLLPIFFYIFLTVLMIFTEEKWLLNKFGSKYIEYCKSVNRCIPWFKKR